MADFDIKEISKLKKQLYVVEKATLVGWILTILGLYYDWESIPGLMIVLLIILYIMKSRLKKKLKQKEDRKSVV